MRWKALAVAAGKLDMAALDTVVTRVVALVLASDEHTDSSFVEGGSADEAMLADNHAFARRAAVESAVLLKNDGGVLPLRPEATAGAAVAGAAMGADAAAAGVTDDATRVAGAAMGAAAARRAAIRRPTGLAVIGEMAVHPRFQGAGSSKINEWHVDEPLAAIRAHVASCGSFGSVTYTAGYDEIAADDDEAIAQAVAAAADAAAAVVFVGLPAVHEAEGIDRTHMRLPEQMTRLVAAVARANPQTVVVLLAGAPVELPASTDSAPSILYMGLSGQGVGSAAVELLFGVTSPSGKLAETWPVCLAMPHTVHVCPICTLSALCLIAPTSQHCVRCADAPGRHAKPRQLWQPPAASRLS